jgi:hypothetical protein
MYPHPRIIVVGLGFVLVPPVSINLHLIYRNLVNLSPVSLSGRRRFICYPMPLVMPLHKRLDPDLGPPSAAGLMPRAPQVR